MFFAPEKIGATRFKTPEGFMVCVGVPIARCGVQIYGPDETPIEAGPDGIVRIMREPDQVFRPETIASAQGKSLIDEHPEDGSDVTPENWKTLELGQAINPRRAEVDGEECLVADILVKDQRAMDLIAQGKCELSCGYAADYEETGPGEGRQLNIWINHVALVEEGRCGPLCAIRDAKGAVVAKKMTFADAIRRAFRAKDEAELKKIEDEAEEAGLEGGVGTNVGPGVENHVHVHLPSDGPDVQDEEPAPGWFAPYAKKVDDMGARMDSMDKAIRDMKPRDDEGETPEERKLREEGAIDRARDEDETEEEKKKREEREERAEDRRGRDADEEEIKKEVGEDRAKDARRARDSVFMEDSWQNTVSLAEIIVPGIHIPTFDRAAKPKESLDRICRFRRKVLDMAYLDSDSRLLIDDLLEGKELVTERMTCDGARALFKNLATMKRRSNSMARDHGGGRDFTAASGPVRSLADWQDRNAAYWEKQGFRAPN